MWAYTVQNKGAAEPWIARQIMEDFIERNKIPALMKIELTSNEAVKQAVLAGLGYSIMPLIGIKNELQNKELQIIPVKGLPIKTAWSLIWLKGKNHAPVSTAFLEYLKKETSQIIQHKFSWYEKYWSNIKHQRTPWSFANFTINIIMYIISDIYISPIIR